MKVSIGAKPLAIPGPVWLIGSYDADGRPNAMTASWVGICCSEPPMLSVAVRRERYSHAGIQSRRAFTVSVPETSMAEAADVFGTASGRDGDKFTATGTTTIRSDLVDAPYVAECPVVMECAVRRDLDLGSHTLFIAEILDVKADERLVQGESGPHRGLDQSELDLFVLCGGYRALGRRIPRAS